MASSPENEVANLPPEPRVESPAKDSADEPEQKPALDPKTTEAEETEPTEEHARDSPPSDARSEGEYSDSDHESESGEAQPPLPDEPLPSDFTAPPLPAEPLPEPADDGWDFHWNPNDQSYWFYNRFTGVWQKENPRVAVASTAPGTTPGAPPSAPPPPGTAAPGTAAPPAESGGAAAPPPLPTDAPGALSNPTSIAGGYNPAIHGDYDENAWYAQGLRPPSESTTTIPTTTAPDNENSEYLTTGYFNRHTGQWQDPNNQNAERHSDESKSRRQMRAFFDVDAAANMDHDGRSLKAERSGIKPSRAELKAFKERRKKKKEEKRRAWLRD